MFKNHTGKLPLLLCAGGLLLALLFLILISCGSKGNPADAEAVSQGIAYLESLEQKDPARVQQIRQEIYQKKLDAQRDEMIRQLKDDIVDPLSMFQDYALLGDSRSVGYWFWDFLSKDRVLADGGHTIRKIPSHLDTLEQLNPSTIYLCYGLNDCSIGFWNTGEEYAEEYMDKVRQIRERLPEATIVISSILPAQDPAFAQSSRWYDIPEWNEALAAACEENSVGFADCSQLAAEHSNLYDPDGIHFREDFYPYWATELVIAALMEGYTE